MLITLLTHYQSYSSLTKHTSRNPFVDRHKWCVLNLETEDNSRQFHIDPIFPQESHYVQDPFLVLGQFMWTVNVGMI